MRTLKSFALMAAIPLTFVACSANPPANIPPTVTVANSPTAQPTPQPTSAQSNPTPTITSAPAATGTAASSTNGLLVEYTRTGGIAGFCDHLQIFANKQVIYKAGCRGGELSTGSSDARVQQAVDWSARVHTFAEHHEDNPGGPDNMVTELTFYGHGESDPTPDQSTTLRNLATDLLTQYAAQVKPNVLPTETKTPATGAGVLIFMRADILFAYDLQTGKEWQVTEAMRDFDWTLDGRRIVMVDPKESGPSGRIWTTNRDGSGAKPLTQGPDDEHPRWSREASQIVFERNAVASEGGLFTLSAEVWIMGANGENPHKLADGYDPEWSPEGKRIAYATNPASKGKDPSDWVHFAKNGIGLMNAAGENKWIPISTQSPSGTFTPMEWSMKQARLLDQPKWSPDGSEITFRVLDGHGAYATTDASNGGFKQFLALFFDDIARKFSYSPNAQYITIGSGGLSGVETVNIYKRGDDGSFAFGQAVQVATLGKIPKNTGEQVSNVDGFAWAPDSSAIAYAVSTIDSAGSHTPKGIYIFSIGGSDNKQVIADGHAPIAWIH